MFASPNLARFWQNACNPCNFGLLMAIRLALAVLLVQLSAIAQTQPATRGAKAFVLEASGDAFVPWGFNYDRDARFRLIEDYWEDEWATVESDFREMKALGANVVRVHLQFGAFLEAPGKANEKALAQLVKLTKLAEENSLYLDVTGLGCYRKADVPAWYDAMSEQDRWNQQQAFWEAVAETCSKSPAIFAYDLMNEPVVPQKKVDGWLDPHELGGLSYVQYITKDVAGRKREEVARAWVKQMVGAIRKHDAGRLITLGMLPTVDAGFMPRDMAKELSYLSVHIYPEKGKVGDSINVLRQFAVGKPVVIEEIFPLRADTNEVGEFIKESKPYANGWMGFYWGKTPDELRQSNEMSDALMLGWLELFQKLRSEMLATTRPAGG